MKAQSSSYQYSIVIPTFNRLNELLLTLPQVVDLVYAQGEIIVIDQSDDGQPEQHKVQLAEICAQCNIRYYMAPSFASVSIAINTGAQLANAPIVLIMDDDLDFTDTDIITKHLEYYREPDIIAVAGCYYAGHIDYPWIPSAKHGIATSLASAHMSARKTTFEQYGAASWLKPPFSTIDWEMAEVFNRHGKVALGEDCFVFHRAPVDGGCGNQGTRGVNWYRGTYHNHTLWMLSRPLKDKLLKLPKHIYTLLRYCIPSKDLMWTRKFWKEAVINGIKDGLNTFKAHDNKRTHFAECENKLTLLFANTYEEPTE